MNQKRNSFPPPLARVQADALGSDFPNADSEDDMVLPLEDSAERFIGADAAKHRCLCEMLQMACQFADVTALVLFAMLLSDHYSLMSSYRGFLPLSGSF